MIARMWRGTTRIADKDAYHEYMKGTGLEGYLAHAGNHGVTLLCRELNGHAEFTFITLWDSWEAIKRFAGPDYENAVFYPEDDKYLVDRGPKVVHYEVLEDIAP